MVYSEFVASDALVRQVSRTMDKLEVCPDERPVAIQIYGRFVDAMREAAQIVVEQAKPDVLDINFGCPVKRVAGKGAGAGMLQNIPLMLEMTKAVVDAVPDTPVTVKTRLGWDQDHRIIVDWQSNYRTAEYKPSPYTDAHVRKCTRERPIGHS